MHQATHRSPVAESRRRLDDRRWHMTATGLILGAALVAWAALAAWRVGGSAMPFAQLVAGAAVAYVVGHLAGPRFAWLIAVGVAVGVGAAFALSPGSVTGKALAAPLHYGNANGALAAQGAAACVLLAVLVKARPVQALGWLGGIAFLALTVLTRSQTATAATALLLLVGVIVEVARRSPADRDAKICRLVGLAAPAVVIAATLVTVAVGVVYSPGARSQSAIVKVVEKPLSERRAALWHDAVTLTRAHPLTGVGPDQFAIESPVAASDRDTRWPHSAWLEQSAEQGLIGLGLLAAAMAWVWRPLLRRRDRETSVAADVATDVAADSTADAEPDPSRGAAVAAIGSWGVGALLLQVTVDYVLHFPAVPWTAALLVGAITGWVRRRD